MIEPSSQSPSAPVDSPPSAPDSLDINSAEPGSAAALATALSLISFKSLCFFLILPLCFLLVFSFGVPSLTDRSSLHFHITSALDGTLSTDSLFRCNESSIDPEYFRFSSDYNYPFTMARHAQSLDYLARNPAKARGAYAYFLTFSQLYYFSFSIESLYRYVLRPYQYPEGLQSLGHLDVLVFIERWPDSRPWTQFHSTIISGFYTKWTKINSSHPVYPDYLIHDPSFANLGTEVFIFNDDATVPHRILVQPVGIRIPAYFSNNPSVLDRDDWLRCFGMHWPFEYAIGTAMFTSQLATHPLITQYDYFIKHDNDLYWVSQPPSNVVQDMAEGRFMMFHSMMHEDNVDCEQGHYSVAPFVDRLKGQVQSKFASEAARKAVCGSSEEDQKSLWLDGRYRLLDRLPLSLKSVWWNDPEHNQHPYSNFIGVYTGWFLSPENVEFLRFMYDEVEDGYLKRRWGDQAAWSNMFGLWFKFKTLMNNRKILDLKGWRDTHFKHQKKPIQFDTVPSKGSVSDDLVSTGSSSNKNNNNINLSVTSQPSVPSLSTASAPSTTN